MKKRDVKILMMRLTIRRKVKRKNYLVKNVKGREETTKDGRWKVIEMQTEIMRKYNEVEA